LILNEKLNATSLFWLIAFFLLNTICGCAAHQSPSEVKSVAPAATVVLFVPGFKGSTLVDETGVTRWIRPWEAIFGSTSLAIPAPDIELPDAPILKADKVLRQIVLLPWIYEFNAYGKFLQKLRNRLPAEVAIEEFPYDWRLSNAKNSSKLFLKIKELKAHGAKKIVLVGHSMGGTLVSYFLRYGAQPIEVALSDWSGAKLVDGVVLVAAPFKGALSIFCDLQTGDRAAFNGSLLSKESLGSFESSYELLPEANLVSSQNVAPLNLGVEFWSQNNLGLLKEPLAEELKAKRELYLKEHLDNAAKFRELLFAPNANSEKIEKPFSQFIGVGYLVGAAVKLRESEGICGEEIEADGDDTITRESAELPIPYLEKFTPKVIELNGHHTEVLLDESVLREIVAISKR
jgi:hypothetical protein